jgi:hypothetical protein
MNETALTHFTLKEVANRSQLIAHLLHEEMKKDVHFGTIPGTGKPTLYKPGAEKILSMFQIGVFPIIHDLSGPDEIRYRVEAIARDASGRDLGSAFGEASSSEEKYKWRRAVCDEEFEATSPERRRTKYGKSDGKVYTVKQIRTEPADVANTVLKMAEKRGFVGITLRVTAASDVFTQDLEDLPEELRGEIAEEKPTVKQPERAVQGSATPPATVPSGTTTGSPIPKTLTDAARPIYLVTSTGIAKTGQKKNGDSWTLYKIQTDRGDFTTFSKTAYDAALNAVELDTPVFLTLESNIRDGKETFTVTEITDAGASA